MEAKCEELKRLVHSGDRSAAPLLQQLKVELGAQQTLVLSEDKDVVKSRSADYVVARTILELGAAFSIREGDLAGFKRYMSLLESFYRVPSGLLPRSEFEPILTAQNLLLLLRDKRFGEFHTLVDVLEPNIAATKEVLWAVDLERCLMEGSYSRVWQLCSSDAAMPRPEFGLFAKQLLATVRDDIAECQERAYESLPLRSASALLFLPEGPEFTQFAAARGWTVDPVAKLVRFTSASGAAQAAFDAAEDRELDKIHVALSTIKYATTLETIV